MKSKSAKATRALKKLKNYRATAYGGGYMDEIPTYGSKVVAPTSTDYSSYSSPTNTSYKPYTTSGAGSYGGGSGATVGGPIVDTSEGIEEEEVVVEQQKTNKADLVTDEDGRYLVSEGSVDKDGNTIAPVYSLNPEDGKTQEQFESTNRATQYKIDQDAADALALKTQRDYDREVAANNKISSEDNEDLQEAGANMSGTNLYDYNTEGAGGTGDTEGGTTTTSTPRSSKAPTNLPRYSPDSPTLAQMEATASSVNTLTPAQIAAYKRTAAGTGYGAQAAKEALAGYGLAASAQQLGDQKDITAGTVTAGDLTAKQGAAYGADLDGAGLKAETYTATKADRLTSTQAATGRVTKTGSSYGAEAATVDTAQRNLLSEQQALGTAAKRPGEDAIKLKIMDSPEFKAKQKELEELNNSITQSPEYVAALRKYETSRGTDKEALATLERLQAPLNAVNSELQGMVDSAVAEGTKYAEGVTTDETFRVEDVEGPAVTTSEGVTISEAKIAELTKLAVERGVDPAKAIQDFKDSAATRTAQTGTAAEGAYKPRLGEAPEETAARARTYGADYTPQGGNTEIDATPAYEKAATRVVQVGEAAQRIATELGDAPSVDLEGREAITGTTPQGNASQIGGIPTMAAASRQGVTGQERKVAAADMMAVVADVPEEVTAAISEDPATVQAQIDEGADPQVVAAVAALPEEALVSTQMEGLLAGMEDGETPLWARPAVAAIEAQMAKRGLSASSVGRDALFNAIIQSALPIAQSNATALQTRAQQNLSNEQQANLASAQNTMQVRMQNLSNRQTAASQTAQMAQEIKVQQGSFTQQATLTTATQEQQAKMATFEAAQAKAQQESAQRQQAAISQLGANAQMDLANLQALNAADADSMTAEQQSKLQTYNAQINKIMRTADLKQDMEKANLAPALQVEMQRVSEMNAAAKDTMSVEQTERLTNLQTLVEFRKTDASFAQQMDMANMTNEQQMELAMLQDRAATDTANFTADNQFRFQELNNIVERSARQADLNQRMEEVNLDSKLKVELSELAEKNTTSRANMTAEQQTRLANLNVLVDFRKTNAAMAQQMDVANLGNEQQMELANLQDRSATDSANFTEANRARTQELNTFVQVMSQNEQFKQNADMAKLSMQEKINLANLSSQSQADMASMSAENIAELQVYEKKMAAGQVNAKLAQEMGLANLSNEQSAAMFNAQINANFDMSQMSNEQQMEIANSKFMQTMTATQFSADQQSAITNATMLTQTNLANADARTRVSVENAKNFLTMDMANLSNEQQAIVLDQQMSQQSLLSDQAAQNVAKQFGATSQNQIDQFLISQSNNMRQFNASSRNAMESFNVTEANRMAAIEAGNELQADTFTEQLNADINKFNATIDNQRDTWNAANAEAVEQSNIQWRRNANLADTAAENGSNQQNVQNAYNISALDQTQMWQQMRDEADYIRTSYENEETRKTQLYATALGNEAGASSDAGSDTLVDIAKLLLA